VFAKSIYNSAKLGASYGIVGGLAYSAWYSSFTCVSVVIYRLRLKGYKSLPEAINDKYGPMACISFMLAIVYRLYQEVWSNQIVVASFYGVFGEKSWWLAVALTIITPALYVLVGGMRASMVSDVWQCLFEVALLIGVLGTIGTVLHSNHWPNIFTWNPKPGVEMYSLKGGIDVLIVGLLQGGFSYGFFDPVLTDRAFLAEPKTMVKSYFVGGCLATLFIIFYSLVGIFGNMAYKLDPRAKLFPKIKGGEVSAVAAYLGPDAYAAVNILMLASSLSVLDSTMSSCAKLFGPELYGFIKNGRPTKLMDASQTEVWIGRLGLIVIAIVGTLTLKGESNAFNATSVSGTTVAGLGPPIIMLEFMQGYNPLAFHIPFWFGICMGIAFQIASSNPQWAVMNGFKVGYGGSSLLLGVNIFVIVVAFGLTYIFSFEHSLRNRDVSGFSPVTACDVKVADEEEKNEKSLQC